MSRQTNAPVMKKEAFLNALTDDAKAKFMQHFDAIYECKQLSAREENILYLAYLWKNGMLHEPDSGMIVLDDAVTCVQLEDFELTIEVPEGDEGGVNLMLTYDFYGIEDLVKMV